MPLQPSVTQIRLDNIVISLNAAVTTVEVISKGLKTPFLGPIVATLWSLLSVAQVILPIHIPRKLTESHQMIKRSKSVCVKMLEQIHQLLYAIMQLHLTSNTVGELTPKMLNNLGQFTE
jgi:hypothetical protein